MRTVIAIKKENVEITDRGVTAIDLKNTIKSHSEIIKKIQSLVTPVTPKEPVVNG